MQKPRIALIHATPVAIEPIRDAFRQLWPEAQVTNLLEDSLSSDLAAAGALDEWMTERFCTLALYVAGCGADAVLFTCSAFGSAIEAARERVRIPVLKPNEAMLDQALAGGSHIGLLATFEPSIPSMLKELEDLARSRSLRITVTPSAVPAALAALQGGRVAEHDQMIASAADRLRGCDVVMLSQFSMASAAAAIAPRPGRRVVTSPHSAVMRLRQMLQAQ